MNEVDFKVLKDSYGYYVVAYVIRGTVENMYATTSTIATLLSLKKEDMQYYLHTEYGSDEESKNNRMHFDSYQKASDCADGLRDLLPKAKELGKLFIA